MVKSGRWQPPTAVHVPIGELPAANCTTPALVLESVFPSLCSFNMARHMNLVGRSFPKRQMEITAIPTCTLIAPPHRGIHQSVVRSHFSLVWLEHQCFPLQRGPFSSSCLTRMPLSGACHVAQAPGPCLPWGLCMESADTGMGRDFGRACCFMGELAEVQRGVLWCLSGIGLTCLSHSPHTVTCCILRFGGVELSVF